MLVRHSRHAWSWVLLITVGTAPLCAAVRLPGIWQHNMVLQRGQRLPVWGWAKPGEEVTAQFGGQTVMTMADQSGCWRSVIGPFTANDQPWNLIVSGERSTRVLTNILVGDVWLCSGQSNMEWPVRNARNSAAEIAAATNALIRLATVHRATALEPARDAKITWAVCSPLTVPSFSAVGYFFARELQPHLGVPIGMINSSWGGTPIESWTSRAMLDSIPFMTARLERSDAAVRNYSPAAAQRQYEQDLAQWSNAMREARANGQPGPRPPQLRNPYSSPGQPAALFNAMIAPVIPFGLRGFLWYQGESNADNAKAYHSLFPAMINDWRSRWGKGDLPFLFVQLANFMAVQQEPSQSSATWPFLREAQTMTLRISNTAMACAIDLADPENPDDIHPKNKQDVARRLALAARHLAYGETLVYSGPLFREARVKGSRIIVSFDHVGAGLTARGGPLKGFAIAGANKQFVWADAVIKATRVVVSSTNVPAPVAVRYSWANNPIGNLYNVEGLPAVPFRSDNWD